VRSFAERYLRGRGLRPTTVLNYQRLLATRINPYLGEMPLKNVTLSEIKAWRSSLNPKTEATNAGAYRLCGDGSSVGDPTTQPRSAECCGVSMTRLWSG